MKRQNTYKDTYKEDNRNTILTAQRQPNASDEAQTMPLYSSKNRQGTIKTSIDRRELTIK